MIGLADVYKIKISKKLKDLTPIELLEICEEEHSSCNENCPVWNAKTLEEQNNNNCPCFRNGQKMYDFIKSRVVK